MVLIFSFSNDGIGVDVHVHRISNRLGWHKPPTKTPEETRYVDFPTSHLCTQIIKSGLSFFQAKFAVMATKGISQGN